MVAINRFGESAKNVPPGPYEEYPDTEHESALIACRRQMRELERVERELRRIAANTPSPGLVLWPTMAALALAMLALVRSL